MIWFNGDDHIPSCSYARASFMYIANDGHKFVHNNHDHCACINYYLSMKLCVDGNMVIFMYLICR